MDVTSSKTFDLLLPSMWGMVTVSLMRLGCSVSSVPVYLSLAEKGSAPTVPATRGWHIPATVPYTNKHQTFCFPEKFLHRKFYFMFQLSVTARTASTAAGEQNAASICFSCLTISMRETKHFNQENELHLPSSMLMDTMGLLSSRPSSPFVFTPLAAHWTLEPAWK